MFKFFNRTQVSSRVVDITRHGQNSRDGQNSETVILIDFSRFFNQNQAFFSEFCVESIISIDLLIQNFQTHLIKSGCQKMYFQETKLTLISAKKWLKNLKKDLKLVIFRPRLGSFVHCLHPMSVPSYVHYPIPIVKFGDLKGAGEPAKVRENIDEKYIKKFY